MREYQKQEEKERKMKDKPIETSATAKQQPVAEMTDTGAAKKYVSSPLIHFQTFQTFFSEFPIDLNHPKLPVKMAAVMKNPKVGPVWFDSPLYFACV